MVVHYIVAEEAAVGVLRIRMVVLLVVVGSIHESASLPTSFPQRAKISLGHVLLSQPAVCCSGAYNTLTG